MDVLDQTIESDIWNIVVVTLKHGRERNWLKTEHYENMSKMKWQCDEKNEKVKKKTNSLQNTV